MFPKEKRANEFKNEIYEIKKWEDKIKREDLKYKTEKIKEQNKLKLYKL